VSRRWHSLLMGVRFAVGGGRAGWTRAVLTAVGVGLAVAVLLLAASVPHAMAARHERNASRAIPTAADVASGPHTVLVVNVSTEYRGATVLGQLIRAEGATPARPPGVRALPGAGEMVVSPALDRLLHSADGALLADRLPYKITGHIADAGLAGPTELAYYAGSDTLATGQPGVTRIGGFGDDPAGSPYSPILQLLVIIGFVVPLVPVAVFAGAAVRLGGERRDRRLAALRLVGADRAMARWISAGEALAGSLLGVVAGALLLLAGRQLARYVQLWEVSVFPADIRPQPLLAALIVVAVPALAVVVTLVGLRRVSIEPLGVVRRAGIRRRRVWWRLLVPLAGLLVMVPAIDQMRARHDPPRYSLEIGVPLFLAGIITLLPWLVEAVVRRLRGGSVSWQLAVRRLQLDSATAARLVSGIAVAVAGGVGLQVLFTGVAGDFVEHTGQDPSRAQVVVTLGDGQLRGADFTDTPGVRGALVYTETAVAIAAQPDRLISLYVADCAALTQLIVLPDCQDGDTFLTSPPPDSSIPPTPAAGTKLLLGGTPLPDQRVESAAPWTIPASARPAAAIVNPTGGTVSGVVTTPGAVAGLPLGGGISRAYLKIDRSDPDVLERIRNTAARQSAFASVTELSVTGVNDRYANVRRGVLVGVVVVVGLIGASLLVNMLEQLADRRRLLAMLAAMGTRRATLGWSLLWQAAVPMLVGMALAVVTGEVLGAILLWMVRSPRPTFDADLPVIGQIVGAAVAVVLLITGASLTFLRRTMRGGGLRTE
jgi:FtsX-like permease family